MFISIATASLPEKSEVTPGHLINVLALNHSPLTG
jgi:hypothetical protein